MRGEQLVLDDPAAAAAERLVEAARAGAHIALAGGSTPRAAYEAAAAAGGDWSRATFWFGDERCAPPDHEHSNYGMAKSALFDRLESDGGPPEVKRIAGELGPHSAAERYDRDLRQALGEKLPRLDLILLGIGPDAHCASLFPGDPALNERERLAIGLENLGLEPKVPRVTLTLPVMNAAREVVFLASGRNKAEAVHRAFAEEPSTDAPSSLVDPMDGSLTVLLDPAAARRLEAGA